MARIAAKRRELTHITLLLVSCGLFFFTAIDLRGLSNPFEAALSEVAREMLENGAWFAPRLNYAPYLDSPFLHHWLLALSFKLWGVSEAGARMVPGILATFSVLLVYFIGRRLWTPQAGFWSALVMTSSLLFIAAAQSVTLYMPALCSLLLAASGIVNITKGLRRGRYFWALGLSAGFLSQGIMGLLLPLILLAAFVFCSGEIKLLRELFRLRAVIIILLLCLSWYILAGWNNDQFGAVFWSAQVNGFFTRPDSWNLGQFFLLTVLGFLPWLALLPWAFKQIWPGWKALRQPVHRPFLLLTAWLLGMLGFLILVNLNGQAWGLPLLPPLALITGWSLAQFMSYGQEEENTSLLRRCICCLAVLLLFFALALSVATSVSPALNTLRLSALVLPLGPILLALGIFHWRGRWWITVAAPLGAALLIMLCLLPVGKMMGNWHSSRTVVQALTDMLGPGDQLVSVGDDYPGLAFYSQRPVLLSGKSALPRLLVNSKVRLIVICPVESFNALQADLASFTETKTVEWLRLDGQVVFSNQAR
ncbi:MAG: glycosyltransferase family 39 protein [Desulfarculales bacterium]|jgi:4-amino-4-deoxy-L-arabinose transferase-like glycosyltransferase|nr:glycosyltransferase family 39 protein [Desulfarculales bacterium]